MFSHNGWTRCLFARRVVLSACTGVSWLLAVSSPAAQSGSLDNTFNISSGADFPVLTIAGLSNGKILVGGTFGNINNIPRQNLARLNADGSVDAGFVPALQSVAVYAVLELTNGQVIVGGDFSLNGVTNIVRLNTNASQDMSFNVGPGADGAIQSLALQPDGKLLVGGDFTRIGGVPRNRIARLNANGTVDPTFAPISGADYGVQAVGVQSDGKVLIGGYFLNVNGVGRHHLARLNNDGSLDNNYDPGSGPDYSVLSIIVEPDEKLLICGQFDTVAGMPASAVARLNPDASLDGSFHSSVLVGSTAFSIALQRDGKLLVVGDMSNGHVVRLNADGSADSSFNPGTGPDDDTYAVALQADGDILIGGLFSRVDNALRPHLARLFGNVPLLNPLKIGSTFTVSVPTVPGKVYTLQSQDTIGTTWTTVPAATVGGNGNLKPLQDTNAPLAKRFYRVTVAED
jgi:uncharacterized delta-60 repeat protein